MKTFEFLEQSLNLIRKEKHWTKHVLARTGDKPTQVYSPSADCFCMVGAMLRVSQKNFLSDDAITLSYKHLLTSLINRGHTNIATFNDAEATMHSDVVAVFEEAIKSAKEEYENI